MFEPFIRVAFIGALLFLPAAENTAYVNVQPLQDAMEEMKGSVQSALPSEWKVVDAQADQSAWPRVDTLRDRYKGYAVFLAGPSYTVESSLKGQKKSQTVSVNKTAVLYFIPVWSGINRTQLIKDWKEGREAMESHTMGSGQAQQGPPPQDSGDAYGWNSKYLLICKHDCEIVQRVAKKFNIPKRQ